VSLASAEPVATARTSGDVSLGRGKRERRPRRGELIIGVAILSVITGMCIAVPILSRYSTSAFVGAPLAPPSWSHPFGTDVFGRDVFTRVFAGGRLNLAVAVAAIAVPWIAGTILGAALVVAEKPLLEAGVMRVVDAVVAFPFVILVLVLVVLLGADTSVLGIPAGLPSLLIAVYLTYWTVYARISRAEALRLRQQDFISAARVLGYSNWRILRRHVLPKAFGSTGTYAVADAIMIIGITASLPFLGAGVQPPTPEWGSIMFDGRTVLASAWWVTVSPGVVLVITGVGLSLVADALLARTPGRE
jgi:ABC-type dipeptide/oligopeptide/nickel transport system permease subunit